MKTISYINAKTGGGGGGGCEYIVSSMDHNIGEQKMIMTDFMKVPLINNFNAYSSQNKLLSLLITITTAAV